MIHHMNLHTQPFEMIAAGNKTIELREKRSVLEIRWCSPTPTRLPGSFAARFPGCMCFPASRSYTGLCLWKNAGNCPRSWLPPLPRTWHFTTLPKSRRNMGSSELRSSLKKLPPN